MQIELGRYFGQHLQTVAFWKELNLLFLKSQRFSKSVEKWPSYGVKRLKMVLKRCFFFIEMSSVKPLDRWEWGCWVGRFAWDSNGLSSSQ